MYLSDIYTVSANLAGLPRHFAARRTQLERPADRHSTAGPPFAEETLLRAAQMFERETPLAHASARHWRWHHERRSQHDTNYTTVVGLEVHVQLLTQTKLFCGCSTKFNPTQPNTQTCPVCLGMPGTLPVMNRQAFELALKTALALNCQIAPLTKWDRKHYYYPDLPKGYQISQYDLPFSSDGWLEIARSQGPHRDAKRIGIIRAHLEEDAGKSMHDETGRGGDSRIDLNRAGTPLLEIVTQPDMRSPAEAKAYLAELKLLLTYLGVSDCNMQEGSLRVRRQRQPAHRPPTAARSPRRSSKSKT